MPAYATFYDGGKAGRRTAVTPKSMSANAVKRPLNRVLPLGTGAVSTATYLLPPMPVAGKVVAIHYVGAAAVTGTSITAEVAKRAADGNSTTTLQASATDVKITSSTDNTLLSATLTATTANLTCTAGTVLQVTITASSITAGPGDLAVQVVYVPSEDTRSSNTFSIGADLL
jgi:hypothetical protein